MATGSGTGCRWPNITALPTRLLDWTYSPYVAMHFTTHDPRHFTEDAAIWCVDYRRTNELLPKELRRVKV